MNTIISQLSEFAVPVFTKIVYTRANIKENVLSLETEEVDMVLALFLSWSENFAWVRFLRDIKPIPINFASLVRKQLGFEDSLHDNRFVEFIPAGRVACD